MFKLYNVDNNKKSSIKGYWLDNSKLYKDYITQVDYKNKSGLLQGVEALFLKGEKAVFYTSNGKGFCIDNEGITTTLRKRLRLHRRKLSAQEFKRLLYRFRGLTVYKLSGRYIIEVFYK